MKDLGLKIIEVTEQAAIASYDWVGRGDNQAADQAAVDAMRKALNQLDIKGRIVIGEGERDEAPMLFIGENLGKNIGEEIDIAVDPLEGTTICATGAANSMSVLAIAKKGDLLNAPDVYMDKIAVSREVSSSDINIDNPVSVNLANIAMAKGKSIEDLTVIILNRPRHNDLINQVRAAGARIQLIEDGDISAVISAVTPDSGVDLYIGSGGAPEGVIAAAAVKTLGGNMMGRLIFRNEEEKKRAEKLGIKDLNKKYYLNDLCKGNCMFAATWVTSGLNNGIIKNKDSIITTSLLMCSETKTVSRIEKIHYNKLV
jgi:fructose-1,6-bisphosphatase II / sedoheptulose-1,7-bisphosphatase